MISDPAFLHLSACAKFFGISRPSLYAQAKLGNIIVKRFGCRTLVDVSSVRRWIEGLPDARDEAPSRRKGAPRTLRPIGNSQGGSNDCN
jgi:hypothetical protein